MTVKTYKGCLVGMEAAREERGENDGLYHTNINILDRVALGDTIEHPEKYPNPAVRVSGYAMSFIRLTRKQQLDAFSRTFHHSA